MPKTHTWVFYHEPCPQCWLYFISFSEKVSYLSSKTASSGWASSPRPRPTVKITQSFLSVPLAFMHLTICVQSSIFKCPEPGASLGDSDLGAQYFIL